MSAFDIVYDGLAEAIVTNAIVMSDNNIGSDKTFPPYFYTDTAAWDTGAQFTVISQRVVDWLHLIPYQDAGIMGIGGLQIVKSYKVTIGLPNGKLVHDVEVYCGDLEDYDILIGMDIITLTDFCITNKDSKTRFFFRTPSEGNIEF
ncbi:MAG: retroviral-like aspartic protease family protein [Paludibacteraceae bacterium]|nr:retroviral-like aspartic protease family protein [Paludibacteraceae bacterium]